MTHFPLNPLCNSLYCQVDFEYMNNQNKKKFHIGFKKKKPYKHDYQDTIIERKLFFLNEIEIYTKMNYKTC